MAGPKRTRLDELSEFGEALLKTVSTMIAPYVPVSMAEDLVRRTMSEAVKNAGVTNDAGAIIAGTSRSTLNRLAAREEPDGYTVIHAIIDYLLPLYPESRTAKDVLGEVADKFEDLSLKKLVRILDYYTQKGYLDRAKDGYQARASFILTEAEEANKQRRASVCAPPILLGLGNYAQGIPGNEVHGLRFRGTDEEFAEFMAYLKRVIGEYLGRGASPVDGGAQGNQPWYTLSIVVTKGGTKDGP